MLIPGYLIPSSCPVPLHVMAGKNMQAFSKKLAARIYDSIISQLSEPVTVSRAMANDSFIIDLPETEGNRNPLTPPAMN